MKYALSNNESIHRGIQRVLSEQFERIIHALTEEKDLHEGIHEARRGLKMSRAVIRLLRYELGKKVYRNENEFLRDQGRQLSFLRDLTAMLETLDQLEKPYQKTYGKELPPELHHWIETRRAQYLEENSKLLPMVAQTLLAQKQAFLEREWSKSKLKPLVQGLENIYRQGQVNARLIKKYPLPHYIHDWRKRAKYLRYHLQLLQNAWPVVFTALEKELHRLTDYLGDFNNLHVLMSHLSEEDSPLAPSNQIHLCSFIVERQEKLLSKAQLLGEKLYTETPRRFAKRMGHYLHSWRNNIILINPVQPEESND